jgi:hypothetical protein
MVKSRVATPDILVLSPIGDRQAVGIPVFLALCAVGMAAIHLVLGKLDHVDPGLVPPELFRFVDMSEEANLPTWFSALLWQIAALLAFLIARLHRAGGWPHRSYWIGMVPLFLFLSLDEAAKVHETIGDIIGARIGEYSLRKYTYSWVIFGLAFVAAVGLVYVRLLLRLRRGLAGLLVLSAAVFLLGAVAIESISASVHKGSVAGFPPGLSFSRAVALEETLEMLGAILLIHVLLRVLAADAAPYLTGARQAGRTERPRSAATQPSGMIAEKS